ncbi:alpha/beta hydrolase [Microbacterium sp. ARD32]|uniref:alpha/beta fold hydrolase n=1 Tax=Microbacterium sp. ARD32 TaxID=2962577 RepID=UPI00288242B6|nr:alpha/beta hydrolase [Microbacterium sp. ARD32]MDT0158711.1 alpha/beta hydrolase [Microbacterium sp. ARD32]
MMSRDDLADPRSLDPGTGLTEHFAQLPDGRRLRTLRSGRGQGPLVVFEAGMSAPAAEWLAVQRAVGARARTLSYDRSGYGGSDDDPHPRTLQRMADDLDAMLAASGEHGPLVLVAHSWGGPIIRAFLRSHPERAAGIVLVDASLAATTVTRTQVTLGRASFRLTSLMVRFGGASRVIRMVLPHGPAPELGDEDMAILTRDYASVRAMRTGIREMAEVLASGPSLRRWEADGLPPVPVIALQGGRAEKGAAARRFRERFNADAAAALSGHPHGRVEIVAGSGHLIPQEQPRAVVDAILEVLGTAGRRGEQ